MKIISVKFQNLNSLKGLHEIRFDRPPFSESSLFAITGPTGAGKTTILDAITVALYGRVHRHDKDAYESMTRHTLESFSEVEFEVNGKVYRAKWNAKKKKKKDPGAKPDIFMELADVATNDVMTKITTEAKQQIVDTCGLDYSQFLRSVMLSQGDFTRFLKASENERSELLEKITDTGIYSKISMFAFEQSKAKQLQLQHQITRLDDVHLMTDEELEALHAQLLELVGREKTLAAEKVTCIGQQQWLEKIDGLKKKKEELQAESERLQAQYEENRPAFDRLEQHKKVSAFMPALAEIDAHRKNIDDLAQQVSRTEAQLPALQESFDTVSGQLSVAEKDYGEALKQQQDAEPKIIEAEKQDVLITSKTQQEAYTRDVLLAATSAVEQLQKTICEKETAIQQLTAEVGRLKEWLSAHGHEAVLERTITDFANRSEQLDMLMERVRKAEDEQKKLRQQEQEASERKDVLAGKQEASQHALDALAEKIEQSGNELAAPLAGKTLEEYETQAAALPQLISLCERQAELAAKAAQTALLNTEQHGRGQQLEIQIAQETALLAGSTTGYEQAREHLAALQENVKLQLLVRKYEGDRNALHPENPCPLCGSTHHPFVEGDYHNEYSEAEQKQQAQQQKVESLAQQVNKYTIALQSLQGQLATLREQQAGNSQERQKAIDSFHAINQQLPAPLVMDKPEVIVAVISDKKSRLADLNQRIAAIRGLEKQQQELKNQANRLSEEMMKIEGEKSQARLNMEHAGSSFAKLQTELDLLDTESNKWTHILSETLQPHQLEYRFGESQSILSELQHRYDLFRGMQVEQEQKSDAFHEIEIGVQHSKRNLEEKTASLKQLANELAIATAELARLKDLRFACFGDKDAKTERQRHAKAVQSAVDSYESIRKDASEKRQELEITRNRLVQLVTDRQRMQQYGDRLSVAFLQKLQANGIESQEKVREYILPGDEAGRIEQLYQEAKRQQTALARLTMDNATEFETETSKQLTGETSGELAAKLLALEQMIAEVQQETGRMKQIIGAEERNRTLHRQMIEEINLQRQEVARWEKLSKLIGSADGKKFSRFAQGLTLERLVQLANRHVTTFTDRYVIRKTPGQDMELEIVDRYQADIVRPVTSLSGGESFLVSLALALGLSELASRKTQINSLFIDEGFGMLDADTLDVAVSALENLQANGKTIGVISHVETLKERIATQIQVVKQHGGHSNIRIVAYGQEYAPLVAK